MSKGTLVKSLIKGGAGGGGSSTKATLSEIKTMAEAIAEKGWACLSHSTRKDIAKADIPTMYNDILDKYNNADAGFNITEDTNYGSKLYDDTDGRTYWFTWDTLNYSESMDISNPQTLTLSEVSYYKYVLLGNNINLVFDTGTYQKTFVRVYNKSWEYIKSIEIDGQYFTKYQKTDNGLVAVAYYNDGYSKLLQVLRVEDDVQADYSITDNIFETYGLTPINIANKIYDNKIYITGRTKENIGLGAIFTLEIDINDFTSIHLYQSDDLGGGYTSEISNLLKYNNTWYIVYETYIYSSSNLINWTQVHNLSDDCYCAYNYNNSNFYFVLTDRIVTTTDFTTFSDVTTYTANVSGCYSFFSNNSSLFLSYVTAGIVYGANDKTIYTDTYSINGNSVAINYYKNGSYKICVADGGTNDTNLATVYSYLGYYNYYRLDTENETLSLPRNSNLWTYMYVGDNYEDSDLPSGNATRLLPQSENITVTGATPTITISANKTYSFDTAITSLTISDVEVSALESVLYFTTGAGTISLSAPNTLRWGGGNEQPQLEPNTVYCIAIRNGLAEIDNFGSAS